MEPFIHTLSNLFEQLGLDSSDAAIETFIQSNKPIAANIEIHNASFWNPSQASFLQQEKAEDADWAEIVDQLDVMLR